MLLIATIQIGARYMVNFLISCGITLPLIIFAYTQSYNDIALALGIYNLLFAPFVLIMNFGDSYVLGDFITGMIR
jgi:hypothetical protein